MAAFENAGKSVAGGKKNTTANDWKINN